MAATKGKLDDKIAVQKAMEKANFKSVRGDFKFGNNHMPIQNFYLQDVVKNGEGDFVLKTVATIVKDSQDQLPRQVPDEVIRFTAMTAAAHPRCRRLLVRISQVSMIDRP